MRKTPPDEYTAEYFRLWTFFFLAKKKKKTIKKG